MVRLLVLYNKPEDTAAFDKYYDEIHIPLAKQLPGLLKYTVSRNVAPGAPYHLVAELDFADIAAFQAAMSSPAGAAATDDVPKFASGGASMVVYEVAEV